MPSLNDFLMNKTAGSANLSFGWYPLHLAFPNSEYAQSSQLPKLDNEAGRHKAPIGVLETH